MGGSAAHVHTHSSRSLCFGISYLAEVTWQQSTCCGLGSPTNNLCHQQFYQNMRCWIDLSNTRKSARRVKGLVNSRHCKSF
ncbi:hypothetical protein NC652_022524 [Populus alba x Populus x berolinensis]|nr:hypothetical protein NC652_022524 [Populus alba x Populus x berolinensis]